MNRSPQGLVTRLLTTVALASISISMGCDRGPKEPAELTVQQLKENLDARFRNSSSKAKTAEANLATALQSGDMPMAFSEARALSANPELSPEERAAAAQAVVATFKELKKAADGGDKQAEDVVHAYISTR
jgi:hypothetical protein